MTATGNRERAPSAGEHVVVIGAGASGLSAALELSVRGFAVTVLDKDRRHVGGRSRTVDFMGCRFDIGAQPLTTDDPELEAFWAEELGEALSRVTRQTGVLFRGKYLEDPFRASKLLLGLGPIEALRCLLSYWGRPLQPEEEARTLEERWSGELGRRFFSTFLKAYIAKVWGDTVGDLPAGWTVEGWSPIPLVEAAKTGLLPGSGTAEEHVGAAAPPDSFQYPCSGIGQLWKAVAARLQGSGQVIRLGEEVLALRHKGGRVIAVTARDSSGRSVDVLGSHFISTMPLAELIARLSPPAPVEVRRAAERLEYRSSITMNVVLDKADVFKDQWVEAFDPSVKVARICNYKNFSPNMVADPGLTGLGMQYFCVEGDELWSSSDAELLDLGRRELVRLGICQADEVKTGLVHRQAGGYHLDSPAQRDYMKTIEEWLRRAVPNLRVVADRGGSPWVEQEQSQLAGVSVARSIATRPGYGARPAEVEPARIAAA